MLKADNIPLRPFEARFAADLGITCAVDRCGGVLGLTYTLKGDMSKVAVPRQAAVAMRKDCLWKGTCLECFIADGPAAGPYWEFNLSPAGHWNVYRFDAYRRGMLEEQSFSALPIEIHLQAQIMHFSFTIDLAAVALNRRVLNIGLCAVVRAKNGQTGYWAMAHPGSRPDFHRRDAFLLEMVP